MADPAIHAISSARRFGGKPEEYLDIHRFMDSSKAAVGHNGHRALTHNSWFVTEVIPRVFGRTFTNSEGRLVVVKDVAEQHVVEDLGYLATPQDYLVNMDLQPWMGGVAGDAPPSARNGKTVRGRRLFTKDVTPPQGVPA